ncbi:uncharacterized protein LOC132739642 [Ruditapes philippinarum]|uniref:uncharacterized protein LOC132739642 n=1 Tax=Ruditapes philippinarum TaxID=129788 RepID=UPI00295BF60B|nr:uncharacterized protein LOC132739642 [Ruditapes philippinarum]
MSAELTTLKGECDRLKDCCANLRAKEQETRAILKSTQEELTGTQDYASKVMKKQGTEIADCSSAIDELLENMTGVLANLSRRAGIENKDVENSQVVINNSTLNKEPLKDNTNISISLVSQILNAANSLGENIEDATRSNEDQEQQTGCENNEKTNKPPPNPVDALSCEQGVVDSPGALSRKKLGFSGNSAFAPVKKSVTLKNCTVSRKRCVDQLSF